MERLPKLGSAEAPPPLGWKAWLTPKTSPFPMCFHDKFGRSASKGVRVNIRELPKLGALNWVPLPCGWGRE